MDHAPDATSDDDGGEGALATVAAWISGARTLVFTGAGVSTESGIPDFRGPHGLWKRVDPKLFTIQRYVSDPEVRRQSWQLRLESEAWSAEPNPAHRAIAALELTGVAPTVVTQNIDGLHQAAGSGDVIEVHGTIHEVVCLGCGARGPMRPVLDRVEAGEEDPACERCGGILKSATISFGQNLDPDVLDRALRLAESAEVCLAVGSTLSVTPAAYVPMRTVESGGRLVIVNEEPTELDHLAALRLDGRAGTLLPRLVELVADLGPR